jgi:hypothetical protein
MNERLELAELACAEGRALIDYAGKCGGYLIGDDLVSFTQALSRHWDYLHPAPTDDPRG